MNLFISGSVISKGDNIVVQCKSKKYEGEYMEVTKESLTIKGKSTVEIPLTDIVEIRN
jgi:hypothetical protein